MAERHPSTVGLREEMDVIRAERHPSTVGLLRFFDRIPVATDAQREEMDAIRAHISWTAKSMVDACPDGPELSTGLHKLLEAKDCFVRAVLLWRRCGWSSAPSSTS
jgi:hypothetical protein